MIHIDVRRDGLDYRVETSVDGSKWLLQYLVSTTVGDLPDDTRLRAENIARTFAQGCRFAGSEVRITSGGYAL